MFAVKLDVLNDGELWALAHDLHVHVTKITGTMLWEDLDTPVTLSISRFIDAINSLLYARQKGQERA